MKYLSFVSSRLCALLFTLSPSTILSKGAWMGAKMKKKNCDAGIKQRVVFILGRCEKTSQEISNNTALQWGQKQRRQY